jgi:hypothetical protein
VPSAEVITYLGRGVVPVVSTLRGTRSHSSLPDDPIYPEQNKSVETVICLCGSPRYLAVQAVDASGNVLGVSKTTTV